MGFAATPDGIRAEQIRQAEAQAQLQKELAGHQREAPGSKPPPRRSGELSVGHPVSSEPPGGDPNDPGHVDTHMWCQPPTQPRDFPVITPIVPHDGQALGSSVTDNANIHRVLVQHYNAAEAASVKLPPGKPSGDPTAQGAHGPSDTDRGEFNTAPSGFGQSFRQNGKRPAGNPYSPVPGEAGR